MARRTLNDRYFFGGLPHLPAAIVAIRRKKFVLSGRFYRYFHGREASRTIKTIVKRFSYEIYFHLSPP